MNIKSLSLVSAISIVASISSVFPSLPAQAGGFTFTRIATNNSTLFGNTHKSATMGMGLGTQGGMSGYTPASLLAEIWKIPQRQGIAINSSTSTTAYYAEKGGVKGIYTSSGTSAPSLITDTSATSPFSNIGQGLAINKQGTVAFFATKKTGQTGIFTHDGVPGTQPKLIAEIGSKYADFYPGLSINDSGTVAFLASLPGSTGFSKSEIFSGNGTVTNQITDCSGAGGASLACPLIATSPTINENGDVAFASKNGVFSGRPGTPIKVVMADPGAADFWGGYYREPNINNNNLISAYAHNNGPGQLIFASNGIDGQMVAGNNFTTWADPKTFEHVGTSAINNKNIVAFMAKQFGVGKGIFIGANAEQDKVIGVGSLLDGAKVVDLAMDRESLSDNNEISFWAKLDNGTQGIYRANKFADSQFNPLLPNCKQNGATFSFCGVKPGLWYDPPTTYGFDYKMTSNSLFTEIMNLPVGFTKPFVVMVKDIMLGQFTAGNSVQFSDYANLLGDLLVEGSGVKEFSILGLNVDATNPNVFPVQLNANTDEITFDIYAREVPEPSSILGLITGAGFFAKLAQKRRQKLNSK